MHATHEARPRGATRALAAVLIAGVASAACSKAAAPGTTESPSTPKESAMSAHSDAIAIDRLPAGTTHAIRVQSRSLQPQAPIDARYTAYGDGISPAIEWTPVDGARAYALLLEDPDAHQPQPFVHWLAWNIPADVHALPEDIAKQARPAQPAGMHQGRNSRHASGYFGPRPPAGDPPHHYHLEVFALDAPLDLPDDSDRDAFIAAIGAHVIAKGELVATSQAPAGAH